MIRNKVSKERIWSVSMEWLLGGMVGSERYLVDNGCEVGESRIASGDHRKSFHSTSTIEADGRLGR